MGINLDKPHLWKEDIARSVDLYNKWFLKFAPKTYREERMKATKEVEAMLDRTSHLRNLTPDDLRKQPSLLFALRMCTAPRSRVTVSLPWLLSRSILSTTWS